MKLEKVQAIVKDAKRSIFFGGAGVQRIAGFPIFAEAETARAYAMIVVGTSLIRYFVDAHLIIINRSQTPCDRFAEYVIHDSLSDVLKAVTEGFLYAEF